MATFFACTQAEVRTHGLEIVEDAEPRQVEDLTAQAIDDLSAAFYAVMARVSSGFSFSTEAIEGNLQKISQYLAQEVANLSPTQQEYSALMSVFQRYLEADGFSLDMLIDNLYTDFVSALGKDKCALLVHRVLLHYCDTQEQKYQQLYEQYGYDVILEEARRYHDKRQVLATRLSPSDLLAGLNTYYIVRIARSTVGQTDVGSFLTTDELLMLIKAQNCTSIVLDADVWYELLTLAKDFVTDRYYAKLMETAIDNGDMRLLAEGLNDFFALVRHVQMTISADDIQAIRQGEPVANVFLSLLDDNQLRRLDAFLSEGWHYAQYNDLAKKEYGDDYQQFARQIETLTIDRLLDARRDAPDAMALLVRYLAGKSYALAWEVNHD